jgi:mevalonate kinase
VRQTGSREDTPPELQADVLSNVTPAGLSPAIDQAIRAFLFLFLGLSHKTNRWLAVDVTVKSQFPSGAGLGSSAAFSVSLVAALMKAITGNVPPKQTISEWAFRCEHIFHGKPSGIDNSICTFGGAILFQSGKVVDEIHDLKKLPALLVYTNVTRNTKLLVESVTRRRERVSFR